MLLAYPEDGPQELVGYHPLELDWIGTTELGEETAAELVLAGTVT